MTVAALALSVSAGSVMSAKAVDDNEVRLVDAETLAALDDEQLTALLEFAGVCGRLALVGLSPDVESVFRNRAGCGGRYLAVSEFETDRLQDLPPPPRANDSQLLGLLDAISGRDPGPSRFGYFIAAYVVLLVVLLRSRGTQPIAAGLSIVSTLLVYLLWPPASTRDFVAWAEASVDHHVAVFRSLERRRTYRDGQYSVEDTWDIGSFPINPGIEAGLAKAVARSCEGDTGEITSNRVEQHLFRERAAAYEAALLRPLPLAPDEGQAWILQYASGANARAACGH